MSRQRLLILLNPRAGAGRGEARLRGLLKSRSELANRARVVAIDPEQDLRRVLGGLSEHELPVAAGGDGTVNSVVLGLRGTDSSRSFGVLPLGTGNTFAHTAGITGLGAAVDALEHGETISLAVLVTDRPEVPVVMVSLSTGFESGVVAAAHRWSTWRRYPAGLLCVGRLAGRRVTGIALSADDNLVAGPGERVFNVGVYNSPVYGCGRVVLPGADPSDARADAVVHRTAIGYWRAMRQGLPAGASDSARRSCRRWTLESPHGIQFDGEVGPAGTYECHVEPDAIRVVAPGPACVEAA